MNVKVAFAAVAFLVLASVQKLDANAGPSMPQSPGNETGLGKGGYVFNDMREPIYKEFLSFKGEVGGVLDMMPEGNVSAEVFASSIQPVIDLYRMKFEELYPGWMETQDVEMGEFRTPYTMCHAKQALDQLSAAGATGTANVVFLKGCLAGAAGDVAVAKALGNETAKQHYMNCCFSEPVQFYSQVPAPDAILAYAPTVP